ncbi:MAG: hypothetical protein AAB449_02635 [Patescibacteria group bacterium]
MKSPDEITHHIRDGYISSVEASERFGITNDYVTFLCRRSKVEGHLLGRLWFVNASSLGAFLREMQATKNSRKKALSLQLRSEYKSRKDVRVPKTAAPTSHLPRVLQPALIGAWFLFSCVLTAYGAYAGGLAQAIVAVSPAAKVQTMALLPGDSRVKTAALPDLDVKSLLAALSVPEAAVTVAPRTITAAVVTPTQVPEQAGPTLSWVDTLVQLPDAMISVCENALLAFLNLQVRIPSLASLSTPHMMQTDLVSSVTQLAGALAFADSVDFPEPKHFPPSPALHPLAALGEWWQNANEKVTQAMEARSHVAAVSAAPPQQKSFFQTIFPYFNFSTLLPTFLKQASSSTPVISFKQAEVPAGTVSVANAVTQAALNTRLTQLAATLRQEFTLYKFAEPSAQRIVMGGGHASSLDTVSDITLTGAVSLTGSLVNSSGATSTFANGIELADGCFSVDGTCLSGGGSSASSTLLSDANTFSGNLLFSNATTTSFAITNVTSSLLKTTSSGSIIAAVAGTDYANFAFPWTPTTSFGTNTNSTSTLLLLTNGLSASSTIRFGNANGSILSFDSATGRLGLGTSTPFAQFAIFATSTTGLGSPTTLFAIASTTRGTSTTTLFIIDNKGVVGIGSSTPGSLLSVNGSTYFGTSTFSTVTIHAGIINFPIAATTTVLNSPNSWSISTSTTAGNRPIISISGSGATSTVSFFGATTTGLTAGGSVGIPATLRNYIIVGNSVMQAGMAIVKGGFCVDADGWCTASTTGTISSVATQVGNSDVAEIYISSELLEPGDIVSTDSGNMVIRSTQETAHKIIGIVSTAPGVTLGLSPDESPGEAGKYPIALSGRVPVKVSTENGPIAVGDGLALSPTIPGVAVKAVRPGEIVGKALQDYSAPSVDRIIVFVQNGYYFPPAGTLTGDETDSGGLVATVTRALASFGLSIEQGIAHITKLVADTFTVGSAEQPAGITLYDKSSGEPYCLEIDRGQPQATPGKCGLSTQSASTAAPDTPADIPPAAEEPPHVEESSSAEPPQQELVVEAPVVEEAMAEPVVEIVPDAPEAPASEQASDTEAVPPTEEH